ncbi:MAG: alpha/beta hydrolase [Rhizomicrobium sp.]
MPRPRPVLLFWYGGSWQSGTKDIYRALGQAFASHGVVTIVADYRLYPEVKYPGLRRGRRPGRSLCATPCRRIGGDPARLFLCGHSAGAYIAVMLAVNDSYLKAAGAAPPRGVIGIAGPYDFLPLYDPALIDIFGGAARWRPADQIRRQQGAADAPRPWQRRHHGRRRQFAAPGGAPRAGRQRVDVKIYEGASHLASSSRWRMVSGGRRHCTKTCWISSRRVSGP